MFIRKKHPIIITLTFQNNEPRQHITRLWNLTLLYKYLIVHVFEHWRIKSIDICSDEIFQQNKMSQKTMLQPMCPHISDCDLHHLTSDLRLTHVHTFILTFIQTWFNSVLWLQLVIFQVKTPKKVQSYIMFMCTQIAKQHFHRHPGMLYYYISIHYMFWGEGICSSKTSS